jgi:hypothetical protein
MFMYYISLCTSCITLVNCGHLLHMRVDHAELKTKIQAEQVQCVFRGPQASSCEDANIIMINASPSAFNQYFLSFILNHVLCSILIMH